MKTTAKKTPVVIVLIGSLLPVLCGGCGELLMSPIYSSALGGALVGGIIGYQSGEAAAGALLGGAIFGVGELFKQTDELAKEERNQKDKDEDAKKVIVEIHNSNGSITPVELKKKGCTYIGPKGEHYKQLPTEKQLAPVYGL